VFCVIDTSIGNAACKADIEKALREAMKSSPKFTLLLTHDSGFDLIEGDPATQLAALSAVSFAGGRDNTWAVREAICRARAAGSTAMVLWLHGPQPVMFDQSGHEPGSGASAPVRLGAISLSRGPNRLLEQLYQHEAVQSPPRLASSGALPAAVASLVHSGTSSQHHYTRQATAPGDGLTKVSDQLARHWAYTEVMKGFGGTLEAPADKAKLAAHYQLVTPYSGAVVLETKEQFDRAGLAAIDPNTGPKLPGSTPEPSTALLTALGGAAALLRRRR
jgi:hypothetical protein